MAEPCTTVLVVDDKTPIIRIVQQLLTAQGVENVVGATSGPEAIRKLNGRTRFDLVMAERFMLPMNALDLKLLMNSRPEWAGIPFVAMLSIDKPGDAEKRAAAGIEHCVQKPFTADVLVKVVNAATAARAAAA